MPLKSQNSLEIESPKIIILFKLRKHTNIILRKTILRGCNLLHKLHFEPSGFFPLSTSKPWHLKPSCLFFIHLCLQKFHWITWRKFKCMKSPALSFLSSDAVSWIYDRSKWEWKKVVVGKNFQSFKDLVDVMVLLTCWLGGAGACVELWP